MGDLHPPGSSGRYGKDGPDSKEEGAAVHHPEKQRKGL